MKKILLFLSFLLMSIGVFGTEYSFFDTQSSELPGSWAASGGTKTINGITWTYSSATYLSLDNSHTKIQVQCKICGYLWKSTPKDLLHGYGCRKCSLSTT